MRVHLTGKDQATACGQCAAWGVQETHDPTKVTCERCKATEWFKQCADGETRAGRRELPLRKI